MEELKCNRQEERRLVSLLTWKPIWVFWPDAMYFPVLATTITEMSLSWPYTKQGWEAEYEGEGTYSEELLGSRDDVSHDEGGSQGVDNMFVVWMENESIIYFACRNKS